MKTITIGRGDGCTITVDDEMMSRRHAIIKISNFGRMEVVDMSKNGTFVNGVRLRPNVPFPVTRKDVVNFADVHQLDWSRVPDPLKYYKLGALVVAGLLALILAISLLKGCSDEPSSQPVEQTEGIFQLEQENRIENTTSPKKPSDSKETSTGKNTDYIDVYGEARANKEKREAEERARQQKEKEKQEQAEKAKQEDKENSEEDESSNKKNPHVILN